MSYKHIICVGVSLIATFCFFFGLLYFLNAEKCPVGTFQCANSTKCIPQRSWCDDVEDCPFGDDELDDNCDMYFWPSVWNVKSSYNIINNDEISDEYLFNTPAGCTYDDSFVRCENIDMPRNLSLNVNTIWVRNLTNISQLFTDVLPTYPQILELKISHSDIAELEKGAFLFQNNLSHLYLPKNLIKEILPGHLIGLKELKYLELNSNEIIKADFSDLDNSTALSSISLRDNRLTTRNLHLPQKSSLSRIGLDSNLYQSITEDLFAGCPELRVVSMQYNRIRYVDEDAFRNLQGLLELHLAVNQIATISPNTFQSLIKLTHLNLAVNQIATISPNTFQSLINLKYLQLDGNQIATISPNTFQSLINLKYLNLAGNQIATISPNTFQSLTKLTHLHLAGNQIATISPNTFQSLINLKYLAIGLNPVADLPKTFFDPLKNLEFLDLEELNMDHMDINTFVTFPKLQVVYFQNMHYCMTYAPNVKTCSPSTDGVSSVSDLLGKPLLRVVVWSISCITCLGNSLVLWGRYTARDDNRLTSIMIKNLAVADLLMGIYLFIIAVEDIILRDTYYEGAAMWMSSWTCSFLGALAMTSSEVSVLVLLLISVGRYKAATTFKHHSGMSYRSAVSSMIIIWIIGLILALVPIIYWIDSTRFYGVNGMCFPLHIDDPFMIGWKYSAFVFLGMNLLGFMIMGYIYTAIFIKICKTRYSTTLSTTDSEYILRIFLIVLTDAACWIPIIGLKILAMMKYPVSRDVYTWVMILILPVNSAINPLLYTFTTRNFRTRFFSNKSCLKRVHRSREISMPDLRPTINNNHNKRESLPTCAL